MSETFRCTVCGAVLNRHDRAHILDCPNRGTNNVTFDFDFELGILKTLHAALRRFDDENTGKSVAENKEAKRRLLRWLVSRHLGEL